ncbi:MAG: ribonuclease Y [Anaerolineaceae bacterium]|jgi:ribonuclease Y|nr:ribonuclease Y [Anaerolineaceae bacterium]
MMNNPYLLIAIGAGALLVGGLIGFMIKQSIVENQRKAQNLKADHIITEARDQAREIEIEAKDAALQITQKAEEELNRRRTELTKEDDRLQKRREELDRRLEKYEEREVRLNKRQSSIDKRANEIDHLYEDVMAELQKVSEMTKDEAREVLLQETEKESRADMARIIRQIEGEAREKGNARARELIADAIQRVASEKVAEVTTSLVNLPNEEMKGRIVGRNGRNIRAFEQASGVDVIVDDTPEAVTVSCFDSVRREIARRSLSRLVIDGRIHPANIEKILKEENEQMEEDILEAGEQAAYDAGVAGLHAEILKKMGRLKFRTSYGQNQLAHAIETAKIASVIAAELGADVEVAKAGAFLHDLGKAMDHNTEGTHAQIGAEFAERHGIGPRVVNVIAAHHHEVDQESVEAVIAEAADAISGARPGARREDLEQYIKRLRALENIANSFPGVENSYAIQAGREVRIIVKPEEVDDVEANRMAKSIAQQIEETMQYPGQIRVTVIRETRAMEYAK